MYAQRLAHSKSSNISYSYSADVAASVTQAVWRCEVKVYRCKGVSGLESWKPVMEGLSWKPGLTGRSGQAVGQGCVASPIRGQVAACSGRWGTPRRSLVGGLE